MRLAAPGDFGAAARPEGYVMLCRSALIGSLLATAILGLATAPAGATVLRFQTTMGNIDVRMFDMATPGHVANALAYVNSNRWDNTFIHRSARSQGLPFVIQGGGYVIDTALITNPAETGWHRIQNFGTVTNEPGISNLRGTMALAKTSAGPSTGTSEWFINLNNNSFLDTTQNNAFTAFGRIVGNGLTVADAIASLGRVNTSYPEQANIDQDPELETVTRNGAFNEVPVVSVPVVQAQGNVFNSDAVRVLDVRVLNVPAGDYNFDGKVDGADLAVWKADFKSTTKAEADGNGNGRVDGEDLLIWQRTVGQNFGAPTALAIPEPAAGTLALLAAAALLRLRRRQ
jgi:peptidyl-prolyl cis-trans isomerase A (cyclophilin A)